MTIQLENCYTKEDFLNYASYVEKSLDKKDENTLKRLIRQYLEGRATEGMVNEMIRLATLLGGSEAIQRLLGL